MHEHLNENPLIDNICAESRILEIKMIIMIKKEEGEEEKPSLQYVCSRDLFSCVRNKILSLRLSVNEQVTVPVCT